MRPFWDWGWLGDHLDLVGGRILEHLWLTFLAVGIGLLIAFPLAVFAYRHRRWYAPLTWFTGTLYSIPSLALFALFLPWTGLSTLTAEIGLVSYTLLILIRNTVTGLRGVPNEVREAARGMGYTKRQLLWRVELPLALPAIVAGIRIATVTTIGLVTVTALIGKGGMGAIMLGAFRRLFPEFMMAVAVLLSVILAVIFDALFLRAQRLIAPWAKTVRERTAG